MRPRLRTRSLGDHLDSPVLMVTAEEDVRDDELGYGDVLTALGARPLSRRGS